LILLVKTAISVLSWSILAMVSSREAYKESWVL
jgi:hypothetical protein